MKKNMLTSFAVLGLGFLLISSCKKKDDDESPVVTPEKDNTVYVINEGNFGSGDGTIDYYSAKSDSILNDIYGYVNVFPLGDVVQNMSVFGDKGYICVNNSQKLEVVNMSNFTSFGTSNGFQGPRLFLGINNTTGYVSDWFSNTVKVINLVTLAITDSIPTGAGPDQMLLLQDKVYVANIGGYGNDSTVTVINTSNNTVNTTIAVGLNPNSLKTDANGKIWVLCGGTIGPDFMGGNADDRAGSLLRINPANNTIEKTFSMSSTDHPSKLAINGNGTILYFLLGSDGTQGKVYKMDITDNALPASALINTNFYGLGIGPKTGEIYAGFAPGFTQAGTMYRYSSNGSVISSKTTGIGPNGFVFY